MRLKLGLPRREVAPQPVPRALPRPEGYVAFFPTNRCNFTCAFCNMPMLKERRKLLGLAEIGRVFGESEILRGLPISIAGGEPFVRPDFLEILDLLTANEHTVHVTSNGWFVDRMRGLARLQRPDRVTIAVSIEGLHETHDELRHAGSFERAVQALEIARDAGCQARVNTVVQPGNIASAEAIAEYFQQRAIPQMFIPLQAYPFIDERPLTSIVYTEEMLTEVARWVNSQPTDPKYVLSGGTFQVTDCHAGATSCYIAPEGNVYACVTMREFSNDSSYWMGDLHAFDLNFDALWASDRAWQVRDEVKGCSGCYTGCEVSRELKHGFSGSLDLQTLTERLNPPAHLILAAPTSNPYLVGEWYAGELGFRWMAREAGVRLMRSPATRRIEARVRSYHPDLDRKPVTVTVRAGDRIAGTATLDAKASGQWIDLSFPVEAAASLELAETWLSVDRTWVPHDISELPDRRRLGLMVERIAFVE